VTDVAKKPEFADRKRTRTYGGKNVTDWYIKSIYHSLKKKIYLFSIFLCYR